MKLILDYNHHNVSFAYFLSQSKVTLHFVDIITRSLNYLIEKSINLNPWLHYNSILNKIDFFSLYIIDFWKFLDNIMYAVISDKNNFTSSKFSKFQLYNRKMYIYGIGSLKNHNTNTMIPLSHTLIYYTTLIIIHKTPWSKKKKIHFSFSTILMPHHWGKKNQSRIFVWEKKRHKKCI